jgi:hypothetical protein
VTRCNDVTTSAGGETAPGRGNGEDDISWTDVNLFGSKKLRKFTWSIQLVQMDGEDLKQQ